MKGRLLLGFTLLPYPLRANGVSVRYLPILQHLSKNHEIDLIIVLRQGEGLDDLKDLRSLCSSISVIPDFRTFRHGFFSKLHTYFNLMFPWNPPSTFISHKGESVTESIRNAAKNRHYRAVIWVGHYLLPNFLSALGSISAERVLVDFIDSPYLIAGRRKERLFRFELFDRYEAWKIRRWESDIVRKVDSVIYISDVDAHCVAPSSIPGDNVHVVPNGINISTYTDRCNGGIHSPNIGFLGTMNYGPNVEAVHWLYENVFIPLRRMLQDLSLVIIGRDPVRSVQELGKNPGVTLTGTVEDIWPYVNSVDIFVFPIWTGAGMKNKILEAMFAGKPVITTSVGNEGIDAMDGKEIRICKGPGEFESEVLRMMDRPEIRRSMGSSAHRFAMEKFSWDRILPAYENLVSGKSSTD